MQLKLQFQLNAVADEFSALIAVIRPLLEATLYALKGDVVEQMGGHRAITIALLARLYRPHDRDIGICFEYAVHDAVTRGEPEVLDRVVPAMSNHCGVRGHEASSILFGAEKAGALNLIDTARERLTPDSSLLYGTRGRPVKLKRHIEGVAAAFRRPAARAALPYSIHGLLKADLFLGFTDSDRWIGTTVKWNPTALEGARGLRVGIIPTQEGRRDAIRRDDARNLVVCPLPYDGSFGEMFLRAWNILRQVLAADAHMPGDPALPLPVERQVARFLVERRAFAVVDVIEALGPLAQPELLRTNERPANLVQQREAEATMEAAVAPVPRTIVQPE
jgi:hypothetical protein